ncbi:MAG: hypothetical protein H7Y88_05780 [Phycisphaerales bacterium]|nr:hypothetical protein [Phycisphaerales bacterium]
MRIQCGGKGSSHARITVAVAGSLAMLLACAGQAKAQVWTRAIVRTGEAAPGVEGATFGLLGVPLISDTGMITFQAVLTGDGATAETDHSLWKKHSADIPRLMAREGQQAPGCPPGVVLAAMDNPIPGSNNGAVGFFTTLRGEGVTEANDNGVFIALAPQVMQKACREGDQAPGLPGATVEPMTLESQRNFSMERGALYFGLPLVIAGDGVTADNDEALFNGHWSGMMPRLREGSVAPQSNAVVDWVEVGDFPAISLNAAGVLIGLSGPGVTPQNNIAAYSGPLPNPLMIARRGNPVLGMQGAVFSELGVPHAYGSGLSALLWARVSGTGVTEQNDTMMLWSSGGPATVVAREGDGLFGQPTGVVYGEFDANADGVLVQFAIKLFPARLAGIGVDETNDRCLVSNAGFAALRVIVREGQVAPEFDGPGGTTFASFDSYHMNGPGWVVFAATLSDGNEGLYVWDSARGVKLIAREGGLVRTGPGVYGTVTDIAMWGSTGPSNGADGRRTPQNQSTRIVFWAALAAEGGEAPSEAIVLSSMFGCTADYNADFEVTSADITAYLQAWFADLANGTHAADLNFDGLTGSADITLFLQRWFQGLMDGGCS